MEGLESTGAGFSVRGNGFWARDAISEAFKEVFEPALRSKVELEGVLEFFEFSLGFLNDCVVSGIRTGIDNGLNAADGFVVVESDGGKVFGIAEQEVLFAVMQAVNDPANGAPKLGP